MIYQNNKKRENQIQKLIRNRLSDIMVLVKKKRAEEVYGRMTGRRTDEIKEIWRKRKEERKYEGN